MALAALIALLAQSGHWEGVIKREGQDMLFSVDLEEKPDWNGSFAIPGGSAPPLPLSGVYVTPPDISFVVPEMPGAPLFKGVIAEAGADIKGTVRQGDRIAVFEMRRIGDARVQLPPPNTTIAKAFAGEWTGTLNLTPPLTLILRLRGDENTPAEGTLDSADNRARNLVLSGIRQEGNSIDFEVRLLGGRFHGEMSADLAKISGSWKQNGDERALVLERARK